jgi:hypothetical protein
LYLIAQLSYLLNCHILAFFALHIQIFKMLFFKTLIVCALSAIAAAQSGANPLVPISGSIQAGQPLTIKWSPTTGGTVSLQLRWGNPGALNAGTTIVCM